MYSEMGADRVAAESSAQVPLDSITKDGVRGSPDVGVLASRDPNKVTVMVWHYHDDDVAGPDAAVSLAVGGLPASLASAQLTHHRIDEHHSNAYAEWLRMGSPVAPNETQYATLENVSELATLTDAPAEVAVLSGSAKLDFSLPRQGVSLLVLEWME
jgi:xylan 1,4-beta-xylosidase